MHFNTILKLTIAWKMMNTILVFLINLLLVRLLGVAASGSFFYDITVLSFIILVLSWCLESGITYYASKDNRLIAPVLFFILPLLLLQGGVAVALLKYIRLGISSYLAVFFIVSNLAIIYFSAFFYAKKRFVQLNIISCGVNFATTLLLFFLWLTKKNTAAAEGLYKLVFVGGIALLAAFLIIIMAAATKKNTGATNYILPVVKDIFGFSSLAFLSNVVFFLVVRIDYFFVQRYCSAILLGNYIQVSKFGQLLILVPSIIASLVFPYSAGKTNEMTVRKVQQLCRVVTLIFMPVTAIIVLTGYWVLPWVFGAGFNHMYVPLLLYLPGFFSLSIVTILAAHLSGKKMLKANMAAALLALVIVATGDAWLIPAGGINAAAAVSSIGYTGCCIYLLWLFKTRFNCSPKGFFIMGKPEIKYIAGYCKKFIFSSTSATH